MNKLLNSFCVVGGKKNRNRAINIYVILKFSVMLRIHQISKMNNVSDFFVPESFTNQTFISNITFYEFEIKIIMLALARFNIKPNNKNTFIRKIFSKKIANITIRASNCYTHFFDL